ncbi:NUDIX domain-containing protein [Actinomadura rupiterrae]|uniref:NUDIX domain-containing protein n=1 Tax=Actinomadura rupiterrae TaxID=559627 RepID=UPI0020A3224A|nr:NUDIX hydrolase [Actinomadura rupiterrae]MCP2343763.1 8-oxo-dGTP pyrophosphatase MutT (NUDIX family) [Actinomadura rupiterrae]
MLVREDEIERGDGSRGVYGVIDRPDFALVIPVQDDGFVLVEEFRYPIGRRAWNFPQGARPNREDGDPEELARMELAQETGLRAGKLQHIGFLHGSHGSSNQGFNVWVASELEQGPHDREPEEQDMRQGFFSRVQFRDMVLRGEITDDSSVAAYTLLTLRGL